MPKAKLDVDWDEVRAMKAAGASAPQLAEKFGVHVSSIYLHLKPNGRTPAGGGQIATKSESWSARELADFAFLREWWLTLERSHWGYVGQVAAGTGSNRKGDRGTRGD